SPLTPAPKAMRATIMGMTTITTTSRKASASFFLREKVADGSLQDEGAGQSRRNDLMNPIRSLLS
ncbi:MAG TPA: hypothetical protein VGJ26_04845, partial [Pirellulales bacterium]